MFCYNKRNILSLKVSAHCTGSRLTIELDFPLHYHQDTNTEYNSAFVNIKQVCDVQVSGEEWGDYDFSNNSNIFIKSILKFKKILIKI